MQFNISANKIIGFPETEYEDWDKLVNLFNYHASKNKEKDKYYEGKITLNDVNLGLALPAGEKIEIVGAECASVSFPRFYELMNGLGCGFTEA